MRDKFTWTSMIIGLALNDHDEESLAMFSNMIFQFHQMKYTFCVLSMNTCKPLREREIFFHLHDNPTWNLWETSIQIFQILMQVIEKLPTHGEFVFTLEEVG